MGLWGLDGPARASAGSYAGAQGLTQARGKRQEEDQAPKGPETKCTLSTQSLCA